MIKKFKKFTLVFAIALGVATMPFKVSYALDYIQCNSPDEFPACYIAFHKIKTLTNPLNDKKFFEDGRHLLNGRLLIYPILHVAEDDLDSDGIKEIIVSIPEYEEEMTGQYCRENSMCPHIVLQDRNTGNKSTIDNVKVLGLVYTTGLGLSTDEIISGYRSFRAYTDSDFKNFDVFQYDKKNDEYFILTKPK